MKRIILVLTAALLLAAMTVAIAPAMAQEQKKEEIKTEETKGKEEEKDKMKDEEKKDLPKSGGIPVNASLLGLGAGVLLVGGGLVAVRSASRNRR
jgi:H+/gluconate symporter-like permease